MNVYVGSAAKLAGALAADGALPRALAGGAPRSVPRRPLLVLAVTGAAMFVPLVLGRVGPEQIVLATSACFVAVYLVTLASAHRLLRGVQRAAAGAGFALFAVLAPFLRWYLLLPAAAAVVVAGVRRAHAGGTGRGPSPAARQNAPP